MPSYNRMTGRSILLSQGLLITNLGVMARADQARRQTRTALWLIPEKTKQLFGGRGRWRSY
jgi:hypothetical protein